MTPRRLTFPRLLLPLLALPASADTLPEPQRLEVFATSAIEVTGVERLRQQRSERSISVYRIDGIEQATAALGRNLPGDTKHAKRVVLKRLQRFGKTERELLQHSADALLLAWQYRLQRYPAVVFDARWVIYGVTDLPHALSLFRQRHQASGS